MSQQDVLIVEELESNKTTEDNQYEVYWFIQES